MGGERSLERSPDYRLETGSLLTEAVPTTAAGAAATIVVAAVTALSTLAIAALTAARAAIAVIVAEVALVATVAAPAAANAGATAVVALTVSILPRALTRSCGLTLTALHLALERTALVVLAALGAIDFACAIVPINVVLGQAQLRPHQGYNRRHTNGQPLECGPAVRNIGDRPCPTIKPAFVHTSLHRCSTDRSNEFAGGHLSLLSSVQRCMNSSFSQED
jgi:hypothetical protein